MPELTEKALGTTLGHRVGTGIPFKHTPERERYWISVLNALAEEGWADIVNQRGDSRDMEDTVPRDTIPACERRNYILVVRQSTPWERNMNRPDGARKVR